MRLTVLFKEFFESEKGAWCSSDPLYHRFILLQIHAFRIITCTCGIFNWRD